MSSRTWTDLTPSTSDQVAMVPKARSFPNMVYHNGLLYIFGGYDGNLFQNDLNCYNVSTSLWVTFTNVYGIKAGPRYSAGSALYGMLVCLSGGARLG